MNGEHRIANPASEQGCATQPALSAGPILPGQPTLVLGRIVGYLGFRREEFRYAGIYRVVSFTNCFDLLWGLSVSGVMSRLSSAW